MRNEEEYFYFNANFEGNLNDLIINKKLVNEKLYRCQTYLKLLLVSRREEGALGRVGRVKVRRGGGGGGGGDSVPRQRRRRRQQRF